MFTLSSGQSKNGGLICKVTGRFAYWSFRLPPVRLRLDSIRLPTVCQFAYVLSNYCVKQVIHQLDVRSRSQPIADLIRA